MMDSPEQTRSYAKREVDVSLDGKREVIVEAGESEGSGRRKHKFSKSKRSSVGEDIDGFESSGKKKSSGERNDSKRHSGGSSRGDIDEGDYDVKKDSSSKHIKKRQESSALEKLSNWYQDGDLDNRHDGGDKSGYRSHSRSDDNERNALRKASSKFSDREGSHRRSKSKDERGRDGEDEKAIERDSYLQDRSDREKGGVFIEEVKNKRRWDESAAPTKTEDGSSTVGKSDPKGGPGSDFKHDSGYERSTPSRLDTSEGKDRALESTSGKSKSYSREERRIDSDKSKMKSRSDAIEEDNKASPRSREDKVEKDKNERHREVRTSGREAVDNRDRLSNLEEDGSPWMREKPAREVGYSHRSRSPDRSARLRHESESSEMEYDRSSSLKRKDVENDGSRDDRVRDRVNNWSDRSRDREGSRESWKRRHQANNDRDIKLVHDRDRERELPRRGRDRMDNDWGLSRGGARKDARSEAVKASTNFGISTENYDVIEIQTKPLDYVRDDPNIARRTEAVPLTDPKLTMHDEPRSKDDLHRTEGHMTSGDSSIVKNVDEPALTQDHNAYRDDLDGRVGRPKSQQGSFSARPSVGQSPSSASQSLNTNQEPSNFGRAIQQGPKGNRPGRGGRIRPIGRDNQQASIPVPLMGSPFGHLGMPPPGPMQSLNPGMSPGPGPPVPPGMFVSPFPPPVWPGNRGFDMTMLPGSPGISPFPPGPTGQRFPPHVGTPPNPAMYFNQPGQGRGMPPNAPVPGFSSNAPISRVNSNEKVSGGWVPPKSGGPLGKAPSRAEQNDYSQNFVDTGMRPQNFIRELELTNVEDYPKLRELIQKKDEIVDKAATPPMYYKCDLREFTLAPDFFGTKFDVILVDPPWEEYVHRAPGVTDHMESWTFEEIMNLKIEAIADTPSFIFLWVGDGVGLEQGRQCLKKWGFRRCEDICWVKTNKNTTTPALRHDSHTLFQHSKEHCLMGIKGTVRRSSDGHIIHANIDTDVIIAEEPPYGSTAKPDEMYRIIEHFALGRRRLELFGEDHNIRPGWLTLGKGLSYSNFNNEAFVRSFADKDGKVWQGGGGRNPPPEAPHLVLTTPEIEALRPKSPMKNQQQLQQQQQSNSIPLTTGNSSNRRPTGNSPQNPAGFGVNQEASGSNHLAPWAPPPMDGFKGPNENPFDMYGGYNMHTVPPNGEFPDFESQRMMGMM